MYVEPLRRAQEAMNQAIVDVDGHDPDDPAYKQFCTDICLLFWEAQCGLSADQQNDFFVKLEGLVREKADAVDDPRYWTAFLKRLKEVAPEAAVLDFPAPHA